VEADSSLAILNGSNTIRLPAQGHGLYSPVGKYSDWPGEMNPPLLNSTVHKRLNSPLFGIQMVGGDINNAIGVSTILQLSDQGDLFYQQLEYCIRSTDSNVQCAAYEGGSTCWQGQLSEDIKEWVFDVEQQEKDEAERKYSEEVDKLGFGCGVYAMSRPLEQKVKDFSLCYRYLESATDFCYSCWAELNKTCEPETMSKDAREGSCKDMEPSSYCQRCGFVFGRPCAIIEQQRKSGRLHCARTSNRLCNSLNGKKPISADVQDAIVKLTPSHHKSKGSSCLPSDAKKVEVDWYGCIATTEVAVPSLVSKPDEKQSAYSLKLWEDWFEGKEPTLGDDQTGAIQQTPDEHSSQTLLQLGMPPSKKVAKRKKKHKIGF
jgi:hypothetical protein